MKARPLGDQDFVAEVTDLDAAAASPDEIGQLRDLLFRHRVLVLRGQRLTPECYQEFMRFVGSPVPHVLQDLTVSGFPAILKISDYVSPDGTRFGVLDGGAYWHADMSYLPRLGIATSLYAIRAADRSGRTEFIDLAPALALLATRGDVLEALGRAGVDELLGQEVVHRFGNRDALKDDTAARQELTADQQDRMTGARHHLVERHPVTGTPGLFAPLGTAMALAGLDAERSDLALDRLQEFVLAELPRYTHRYEPGDLVIWDNTSTLHRGAEVSATSDFELSRLLYRINVDYSGTPVP
ncbi:TauD/TfdA dioxygenase family protein [Kitasatospora sp. NPDC101157]|uniref:TauD/TfdA dioxygenase family protein n=1 Tax=Kitasatospora sp. NPDC101157 TaxID=3364098 RepID=UPI003818EB39